jgi:hypothetical protein
LAAAILTACGADPALTPGTVRVVSVADAPAPVLEARWQDEQVRRWTQVQFFYDVAEMGYRVQLDYAAAYARAAYNDSLRQVTEVETYQPTGQSVGNGNCGGSLPSCAVMMCESRDGCTTAATAGVIGSADLQSDCDTPIAPPLPPGGGGAFLRFGVVSVYDKRHT